jgi:hypothetical protein
LGDPERLLEYLRREAGQRLFRLVERLRVSRPVRLLVSSLVEVPTVIGWLRPVVLVPVGALTGLPAAHVTALLAHELAHVRRLDYLANMLQRVVETVLFYHPAVWWVSDQIRSEREMCCDDLAVGAHGDALTYARALADLESCRRQHSTRHRGAALAADGMSLLERIRRLLGHRPSMAHVLPTPSAAVSMTLLWALGIAVVAAHGASSSRSDVELAVLPGPRLDVGTMPDTRALISAVLLGPVGPSAGGQSPQQPLVTAPRPGVPTAGPDDLRNAGRKGRGIIRGRVLRFGADAPLRRVLVSLRAEGRSIATLPPVPPTVTDDAGRFELTELAAGQYRLFAEKGGFVMTEEDRGPGLDPRDIAGRPVVLRDGERIDHVDLNLVPGGVIAGQVLDERRVSTASRRSIQAPCRRRRRSRSASARLRNCRDSC